MFRGFLFTRIVPVLRDIGLWGPRIRAVFDDMGVLAFADADIEELVSEDEAFAEQIDQERLQAVPRGRRPRRRLIRRLRRRPPHESRAPNSRAGACLRSDDNYAHSARCVPGWEAESGVSAQRSGRGALQAGSRRFESANAHL